MRLLGNLALGASVILLTSSSARSQFEYSASVDNQAVAHTQTVSALNAEITALRGRLDRLESHAKAEEEGPAWTNVSGEKWKSKFGGRIMGDYVMWADQDNGYLDRFGDFDNYMEFRRIRMFTSGEGYGVYIYKLELDFEPEGITGIGDSGVAIKDLYVGMKDVPFLGTVYLGNQRVPMSIEELTSSNHITFLERALPNIFASSRRVGLTTRNTTPGEAIGWGSGVYFDDIETIDHQRIADSQGIQLGSRLWGTPYYCEGGRHLFHLGVSGAWVNAADDIVIWLARPEVHEGNLLSGRTISTGIIQADEYYTAQCEAALVWGPASLQSEFFYNSANTANGDLDFYGAYAQASWFLTGENRVYERDAGKFGRVKPFTNFWIVRGSDGVDFGWGGWELAARWSYLDLASGPGIHAGQQNNMTFGVNWYWNPHTRFMFNWIHPFNDYNIASPGGFTRGSGDILSFRLHVDF